MATLLKKLAALRPHGAATAPAVGKVQAQAEDARVRAVEAALRQYKDAPLGTLLRHLIAAHDGIRPEEVTTNYIRDRREALFYPNTRYDIDSKYGGYDGGRLKFLTRSEFDAIAEQVELELARIGGRDRDE